MNELVLANRAADWRRLKMLVLDSVSSPITKRVYNLGLDEFFEWFGREPWPGFTKATVSAWRVALEARGLGSISINVRITAVRKLAVEAADNGLLAPELAAGITRIKGVKSKGVRVGNWLSIRQAQTLLNTPDVSTKKGLRDRAMLAVLLGCGLRRMEISPSGVGIKIWAPWGSAIPRCASLMWPLCERTPFQHLPRYDHIQRPTDGGAGSIERLMPGGSPGTFLWWICPEAGAGRGAAAAERRPGLPLLLLERRKAPLGVTLQYALLRGGGFLEHHTPTARQVSDEEDNLRRVFALSREFGWHQAIVGLLHGLFALYWHTGRRTEWAQLLTDALPDFVDDNGRARPGKECWWTFMTDQAVRMEMWRRDFPKAEILARAVLESEHRAAAGLEATPAHLLSPPQKQQLQSFAIALSRVADILRERNNPECLGFNERALAVYSHIDDRVGVPLRLFNLGHIFKNIPTLRDLEKAEECYTKAYESYPEHDHVSRLQCVGQLGSVALQRLKDELGGQQRPEVLSSYLNAALEYYETVLQSMAPDDVLGLADVHNQLGVAYQYLVEEQSGAFEHFRIAIECFDRAGESYEAASARNNAAQVLQTLHRFDEAIVLAREALAAFESFDPNAPLAIHLRRLVARLERDLARSA